MMGRNPDEKCDKCGAPYIPSGGDSDGAYYGPSCECWLKELLDSGDEYLQDFDEEEAIEPYFPGLESGGYPYDFDEEDDPGWIEANNRLRDDLNEQAAYQSCVALTQKYWIGNYDYSAYWLPIYRILSLLEDGSIIPDYDLLWLEKIKLFTLVAHCYWQNFRLKQNGWDHVSACKFFRTAGYPQVVVNLTNQFFPADPKMRSFGLTNRGGAFRDLHQFQAAIDCANAAIMAMPNNCGPYLLLGGVYFQLNDLDSADFNFRKARELGARPAVWFNFIDSELQRMEPVQRQQAINYFLMKDPILYSWVGKYSVS